MKINKVFPIGALLLLGLMTGCVNEENLGTRPEIISVDPINEEVSADGLKISATFSTAMNPATITTSTFMVKQGATPVSGTVTYSGMIASFIPLQKLEHHTTYTATITTGAQSIHGQGLADDY